MIGLARGRWILLTLLFALAWCCTVVHPAMADADIKVSISNPDNPNQGSGEGNTVNTVVGAPSVSIGDNQILGLVRVTGKPAIKVPIQPGSRIKLSLSCGVCYMRVPDATNYRKYVRWPEHR